jgi:hypothetical protein
MKDYTTITGNNNGLSFPDTLAINSSGALATDGTEYLKEVVDDIWGEKQALLDFFNYPPNGLVDVPGIDGNGVPVSQPLRISYMNYGRPGTLVEWMSENLDPGAVSIALGCDLRILLLQGQGVDRTMDAYKALDWLTYCGDPNNATADYFYHADDAGGTIRNTAGDYLILPDMRGYATRGLDKSGAVDSRGVGRIVGSVQEDALQNITGNITARGINGETGIGSGVVRDPLGVFSEGGDGADFVGIDRSGATDNPSQIFDFDASTSISPNPAKTDPIETTMKNIAVRYGIYY